MFSRIIAGKSLPRHLSSDHDPLFRFHRWLANLRILEVEEIKSIPYVPVSHPFVERLDRDDSTRVLDHVLIWNAIDLERKLGRVQNLLQTKIAFTSRSVAALQAKDSGQPPPAHAVLDHYAWRYHCRGLFQMQSQRNYGIRAQGKPEARSTLIQTCWSQSANELFPMNTSW